MRFYYLLLLPYTAKVQVHSSIKNMKDSRKFAGKHTEVKRIPINDYNSIMDPSPTLNKPYKCPEYNNPRKRFVDFNMDSDKAKSLIECSDTFIKASF